MEGAVAILEHNIKLVASISVGRELAGQPGKESVEFRKKSTWLQQSRSFCLRCSDAARDFFDSSESPGWKCCAHTYEQSQRFSTLLVSVGCTLLAGLLASMEWPCPSIAQIKRRTKIANQAISRKQYN